MTILLKIFCLGTMIAFGISVFIFFKDNLDYRKKENKIKITTKFWSVLLLAACMYLITVALNHTIDFITNADRINTEYDKVGPYGDLIGGVLNPVVAFIGIVAASLAFYVQYRANQLIQEQFDEQKRIDYRQNFETTFFNMLTMHHQFVENIDVSLVDVTSSDLDAYTKKNKEYSYFNDSEVVKEAFTSSDAFNRSLFLLMIVLIDDLIFSNAIENNTYSDTEFQDYKIDFNKIEVFEVSTIKMNNVKVKTKFMSIYFDIYEGLSTDFGHYFRNLYRIVKIIDERKFSSDKVEDYKIKYSYTSILRAQLSDDEIKWLFFNCISNLGNEKFKPLLEKYSLLKILADNQQTPIIFYSRLYKETAFRKATKEEILAFPNNKTI